MNGDFRRTPRFSLLLLIVASSGVVAQEFAPTPDEEQLPLAMHSKMEDLPHITVGHNDADIVGHDQRALQAAVDYIAGLGGGVVTIGPGEYVMHDSLHLRSHITVRGAGNSTIFAQSPGCRLGAWRVTAISANNRLHSSIRVAFRLVAAWPFGMIMREAFIRPWRGSRDGEVTRFPLTSR